jgi:predicted TIM-barrel fold metal-dependent hydrolase
VLHYPTIRRYSLSNRLPEKIIDFHVHLFPDRLFEAIWKYFTSHYKFEVIHQIYYRECITYLRHKGVTPIVYSNYAHRKGIAGKLNEWNLRVLEEYDDLFCFAAYHPDDDDALSMAEQLLDNPKIVGFKLQLAVQQLYPHDKRLFPLYELVMDRKKRLLFHVGPGPVEAEYLGLEQFIKVLAKYPELPAIVAHMGAWEYQGFMDILDDHSGIYLDTAYAFLREFKESFNLNPDYLERYKDRILYGSDFPNLISPRETEIDCLLQYDLSQEFYRKIFYENAMSLLTAEI